MRFAFLVLVSEVIIVEAAHQHNAASILIPEQRDGCVNPLLQVTETHNVAEGLDAVQDTVGAAERLNQTVHLQVLVHP